MSTEQKTLRHFKYIVIISINIDIHFINTHIIQLLSKFKIKKLYLFYNTRDMTDCRKK